MNSELMEGLQEVAETLDAVSPNGHGKAQRSITSADDPNKRPAKVTFDEAQQRRVDELIREAQGRAARELREANARLQAEVDAYRQRHPNLEPGELTLANEVAQLRAEKDALAREREQGQIEAQLRQAAGDTFIDADAIVKLYRGDIRLMDGRPVVVDESGNPRLNETLDPMSPADLLREVANTHKWLVRSTVRGGTGSTEASRSTLSDINDRDLARLFGPQSDSRAANQLALRDPAKYKHLRVKARERGLVA